MSRAITTAEWTERSKNAFRSDSTEALLAKGKDIIAVGTKVVAYTGMGPVRGTVLAGPNEDFLFTGPAYEIETDGMVARYSHHIVVTEQDFDNALHLVADGVIVSGGPGMTEERLLEIQQEVADEYPVTTIRRG